MTQSHSLTLCYHNTLKRSEKTNVIYYTFQSIIHLHFWYLSIRTKFHLWNVCVMKILQRNRISKRIIMVMSKFNFSTELSWVTHMKITKLNLITSSQLRNSMDQNYLVNANVNIQIITSSSFNNWVISITFPRSFLFSKNLSI